MQVFGNQNIKVNSLKVLRYSNGRIKIRRCCRLFKLVYPEKIEKPLIKMMHRFVLNKIEKAKLNLF